MARRTKTVGGLVGVAMSLTMGACDPGPSSGAPCGPARLDTRPEPRWIALEGQRQLAVFVDGAQHPIAGQMFDGPQGVAFRPAFPLSAGMRYRVQGKSCEVDVQVPPSDASAPEVVAVYPGSPSIPENILRFYVAFSEPMAEGDFLQHIRLEHVETGEDLTGVFFDNVYELWSPDRRRITLLVDPGRVKTGLRAHRALGRAFEAGQTYRLHVLPTWTSLAGRPLGKGFTRTYHAEPEDRRRVEPLRWCLSQPQPGTREPLRVEFHEPVDHVSVGRFAHVTAPNGTVLPGAWSLEPGQRTARWTPQRAWLDPIDAHGLRVNSRFEDIAGNNVNAAMDHPYGELPPGDEGRAVLRPFAGPCS